MSMTPSRRTVEAMTLGGMAADNRTIIVRCYTCHKTRMFLTVDLVKVYGETQSPHTIFTTCSKCGASLWTGFGFPSKGQKICRPFPLTRWSWCEVAYDPDAPVDPATP